MKVADIGTETSDELDRAIIGVEVGHTPSAPLGVCLIGCRVGRCFRLTRGGLTAARYAGASAAYRPLSFQSARTAGALKW